MENPGLNVKFKASGEENGNASIIMSGTIILTNDKGKVYKIPMPCFLDSGVGCVRIAVVIPGYDDYLYLPPGKYTLSLVLSWTNASGQGELHITIDAEAEKPST